MMFQIVFGGRSWRTTIGSVHPSTTYCHATEERIKELWNNVRKLLLMKRAVMWCEKLPVIANLDITVNVERNKHYIPNNIRPFIGSLFYQWLSDLKNEDGAVYQYEATGQFLKCTVQEEKSNLPKNMHPFIWSNFLCHLSLHHTVEYRRAVWKPDTLTFVGSSELETKKYT